jgi:bifunctional non-homologous end joining protein LigD
VAIYSRNAHDFTNRYPAIARDVLKIPTKQFIIDAELTAIDGEGMPAFGPLLSARLDSPVCIWVFDVLSYRGKDVRHLPWIGRRYKLDRIMDRSASPLIQNCQQFDLPETLLVECTRRGLEGIVSKRIDRPYISGRTKDWIKVKCAGWKGANTWRHEFFAKRR